MLTPEELDHYWLPEDGCSDYTTFANGRDAMIMRLMYTHAIIADLTTMYYGDRWCYHTYADAKAALTAWDGEGEPSGWHRHPDSGRRRPNGDPAREYVNP
ncbi:hypothetical protein ACGYQ5_14270 [Burkholderia pseudomallei]